MSACSSGALDASRGASTVASARQMPAAASQTPEQRLGEAVATFPPEEQLKINRFRSIDFYVVVLVHHLWFMIPALFLIGLIPWSLTAWALMTTLGYVASLAAFIKRLSGVTGPNASFSYGRVGVAHAILAISVAVWLHLLLCFPDTWGIGESALLSGLSVIIVVLCLLPLARVASPEAAFSRVCLEIVTVHVMLMVIEILSFLIYKLVTVAY